jgi:uncharacterized protein (TIGR00730 family)
MADDTIDANEGVPELLPEDAALNELLVELAPEAETTAAPKVPDVVVVPPAAASPVVSPTPPPTPPPAPPVTPPVVEPVTIASAIANAPAAPVEATPAPTPAPEPTMPTAEQNIQTANKLSDALEEGKHKVPENPMPLVAKPTQLESWRVFKIMAEFVDGFELVGKYTKAATFFGSERTSFDAKLYTDATELAGRLAKSGFAIITGGSDGIMEAANKGAFEAGGASIGLNIRLADSQKTNKYVTESMMFDHFFVRKVMLAYASEAYIYFPGGFGTLDEFTEILTLVQTKNIKPVPIILYGKEYWTPIMDMFKNDLDAKYHAIDPGDTELYHLSDSVDEAYEYICKTAKPR